MLECTLLYNSVLVLFFLLLYLQHLSKLVVDHMEAEGVEFLRDSTPLRVDRIINESGKAELQVAYSTGRNNCNDDPSLEMHKVLLFY